MTSEICRYLLIFSSICIAESKSIVSLQRVHFSVEKRKSKDASHRCSASFAFIVIPLFLYLFSIAFFTC